MKNFTSNAFNVSLEGSIAVNEMESITDPDTAYIPLTLQTTNTIDVQAYLTLTLDTGGLELK